MPVVTPSRWLSPALDAHSFRTGLLRIRCAWQGSCLLVTPLFQEIADAGVDFPADFPQEFFMEPCRLWMAVELGNDDAVRHIVLHKSEKFCHGAGVGSLVVRIVVVVCSVICPTSANGSLELGRGVVTHRAKECPLQGR